MKVRRPYHALPGLVTIAVSLTLAACASLPGAKNQDIELSKEVAAEFKPIPFTQHNGLTPYSSQKTSGHGEWIACVAKTNKATALLMHSDQVGYDKRTFCSDWTAQAFLSKGFDVITVNRPGFGGSDGQRDFIGETSLKAITTVAPIAVKAANIPNQVSVVWGYGTGASAAALASKRLSGVRLAILGGGIFDYEETLKASKDAALRKDLTNIKKSGGDKAFDDRSVAYDLKGLPPTLILYHGADDVVAPITQAKAFTDSLASNGSFKVTYQVVLSQGHDIPWVYHRHLVETLLSQ